MSKDVIIACDFNGKKEVMEFLDKFTNEERKPYLKIGMELFYGAGPEIVREINSNKELVSDEEFLSNNVYFYDRDEGKLMIV